jgi:hypothetical protein
MLTFDMSAQEISAKNNPGYFTVTIEYTWVNCAQDGSVRVWAYWDGVEDVPYGDDSFQQEGDVLGISTLAYGSHIVKTKVACSANNHQMNGSGSRYFEWPYYVSHPVVAPNPCKTSNGCKRYPKLYDILSLWRRRSSSAII